MPKRSAPSNETLSDQMRFEQERARIHSQMLSSVSHDLKTPLAAIIGSLEIIGRLKLKLPEEKKEELVDTALKEAYRLDNFVSNILDMAKLENGMITRREEVCDIESLLRDCVEKFTYQRHAQIHITPPAHQVQLQTDPGLFCRIVSLLVDNAIKHGGTPPVVYLNLQEQDMDVVLRVSDNGKGVPADKIEHIFSKYTRFTQQDRQNAGTGLGLAIGREIARLLEGTLQAVNGETGATEFVLTLPRKK